MIYFRPFLETNNSSIGDICTDLWNNSCDWYSKPEYEDGKLVYKSPPLNEVWIDETAFQKCKDKLAKQRQCEERE